ncbi:MAG: transcriptional regulator [Acidimicrobiia bacterium]|nr:transcriptional regulator [Acidimicrobiia bacterium]MDH4364532.1 transcriptional regulator [Acidimicrobiia bacterium]MDH5288826.1 transcriptional regulator [Acidimicrobiia bacterium]
MRADRLVAVLLLLQRRGKVTAAEVASELEVSERTARRDLEALSMAGLPVYATQGRGGGWHLLGGGRTDLSGLSAAETRALFVLAGPRAATPELRAALRKLVRALPEPLRDRAEAAADAVVLDPMGWDGAGGRSLAAPPPTAEPEHLAAVQDAVIDAHRIWLDYVDRVGSVTRRTVDPWGLAAKAGRWYLVAGTDAGRRTFRVDRVRGVEPTGEAVVRPPDFDLAEAWAAITAGVDEIRLPVQVRALVDHSVMGILRRLLGERVRVGAGGTDGRAEVEIRAWNEYSLAAEIAGFGRAIEVLSPPGVRAHLARIAGELASVYGQRSACTADDQRVRSVNGK